MPSSCHPAYAKRHGGPRRRSVNPHLDPDFRGLRNPHRGHGAVTLRPRGRPRLPGTWSTSATLGTSNLRLPSEVFPTWHDAYRDVGTRRECRVSSGRGAARRSAVTVPPLRFDHFPSVPDVLNPDDAARTTSTDLRPGRRDFQVGDRTTVSPSPALLRAPYYLENSRSCRPARAVRAMFDLLSTRAADSWSSGAAT